MSALIDKWVKCSELCLSDKLSVVLRAKFLLKGESNKSIIVIGSIV